MHVQINCTVKLTQTDDRTIRTILQTYRSKPVDHPEKDDEHLKRLTLRST
jgi:hypothetical protein